MIYLVGGPSEGRLIASRLVREGFDVVASVTTEYGARLLEGCGRGAGVRCVARRGRLRIVVGPLDAAGMAALIRDSGATAVVDASHPYAAEASRNAIGAAAECGVKYIRYERGPSPQAAVAADDPGVVRVAGAEECLRALAPYGRVLLAVGSETLGEIVPGLLLAGKRVSVRVLPTGSALRTCEGLGLGPGDIIACQGPFSEEFNRAAIRHFGAEVLVTKESGVEGGFESKLSAARLEGIPVVVLTRPRVEYPLIVSSINDLVAELARPRPPQRPPRPLRRDPAAP